MPTLVAIVSRVSTAEQALDNTSLDRQRDETTAYALREGWEVTEAYVERGFSGAKAVDERPELQRLLADAKAGKFKAAVWPRLDRMFRSQRKAIDLIEALEALGVEVRSVAEPLDASTSSGRLFRDMLLRFAEFERDVIRDRVVAGTYDTPRLSWLPLPSRAQR